MDDIRPLFFATQVLADLRRPQTHQIRSGMRRISQQNIVLEPFQKLKKTKQQMRKAKNQYFKTLSQSHRLQLSVSKLQRKKHKTRAEFIKVYGNLKYKKYLQDSKMQHQSKSKSLNQERFDRTKKKKLQEQLQKILSKSQEQDKIQFLQKKNKKQKQKFSQIKDKKTIDVFNWTKSKHDTIRNQHTEFVIRKSNISSILHQRSKLNYMKKINKQLSLLKEYENVIQQISDFNISEIQKLTFNQEKDKGYETFFMTTKNTFTL